jgi:hypothetical protein
MKKLTLIYLTGILTAFSYAQETEEKSPRIGISTAIQSSSVGIQIPIWLGDNIVLAPSIGAQFGDNYGWVAQFGLAPRFYLNDKVNALRPYLGIRAATIIDFPTKIEDPVGFPTPDKTENIIDLIGGLNFGGEYFFSPRFSVGLEIQANIIKSDENSLRFGNPGGINFNTGALALINIYF